MSQPVVTTDNLRISKMEEKLNELLKLKEIQDRVITLRTGVPFMYGMNLRKECSASIKNLLSSKVKCNTLPIEVPKEKKFDANNIIILPETSLAEVSMQCNRVSTCLMYIGK